MGVGKEEEEVSGGRERGEGRGGIGEPVAHCTECFDVIVITHLGLAEIPHHPLVRAC